MEFEPMELDLGQEPMVTQKDVIVTQKDVTASQQQPTLQPSLRRKAAEKGRKVWQDLTRFKR